MRFGPGQPSQQAGTFFLSWGMRSLVCGLVLQPQGQRGPAFSRYHLAHPCPWDPTSCEDSTLFLWQLALSVHSSKENRGVDPQGQRRSQGSVFWPLQVSVQS